MFSTVGKQFDFPAAHRNLSHEGHCSRVHGHTWTLEVICRGKVQETAGEAKGMVIDFSDIKKAYEEVIEPYVEHEYLNESLDLPEYTTEHIAAWAFRNLERVLPTLHEVKLWEGKTSYAVCRAEDRLR
jgi:6-pyruvoyltetrahydropterin/6-carboxytetrahydropterin synthase